MKVYIISGPTGSGKNTVAEQLAKKLDSAAIIDFDTVRAMFTKPHNTPWDGEVGKHQNELTIELVCHIANIMNSDGRAPIVLDVVDNETAKLYREKLEGDIQLTQLSPPWETIVERNRIRAEQEGRIRLTSDELERVFRDQQAFTTHDQLINNTAQNPETTAKEILNFS